MSSRSSTPLGIQNYFLIRCLIEDDMSFVTLENEQPVTLKYPSQYLYREATKEKGQPLQFRIGLNSFIRAIQEQWNTLVMQYHVIQSSTYLTGRYFTLGLRHVSENKTHHISKYGNNIPMQLFICKEDSKSKFLSYVNRDLAIVNKMLIKRNFSRKKIERKIELPSGTIYFFYTISHCLFALEEYDEQQSVPVATISSTGEASASTSTSPTIQLSSLENMLNNLPDSARAQSAMSFVEHVEVKLEPQDCTDEVHAQTMEGSGDNSDDSADDGESFNDVVDCYRDENVALRYALADKEGEITELKNELIKLQRQVSGTSPSSTDGISSSPRARCAKVKRKLSFTSDDGQFREVINRLEDERHSLLKQVEEADVRLRDSYDRKIVDMKKQQAQSEDTIRKMQARITELELKEKKITEKISLALTTLESDQNDDEIMLIDIPSPPTSIH